MTIVTKSEKLLKRMPGADTESYVSFSRDPDEPEDFPASLAISRDEFLDLGSPEEITVTVEPGDRLNDGDS